MPMRFGDTWDNSYAGMNGPAGATPTGRTRPDMRTRFDSSNTSKNRNWLEDRNIDEIGNLNNDIDYQDQQSRGADQDANNDWQWYRQGAGDLGQDGGPDGAGWQDPTRPEPDDFSFRDGPDAGKFGDYADYYAKNKGLTGSTEEGDLSKYDDPSFYQNNVPAWMKDKLAAGSDIGSPDFDGDFRKYTDSAKTLLDQTLRRNTDDITNSAAGMGRLNTGFYDDDIGRMATDVAGQYAGQIGSKAVDVLGLKQADADSRRKAGAQASRSYLDAANLSLDIGKAAQGAAIQRATNARNNRQEMRDAYEGDRKQFNTDRTFGEDQYRDRRDTARNWYTQDRTRGDNNFDTDRTFSRDRFVNDRNFATDRYRNNRDFRFKVLGDTIDRSQKRQGQYFDQSQQVKDRYYDWMSGLADRAGGREEARVNRRNKTLNGIIGAVGGVAGAALGKPPV